MLIETLEPRRLLANYSIVRLDGESGAIDPSRETWLIVHGWRSSPSNFAGLAAAINASDNYASDQILAIDWTESAQTSITNPFSAEAAIPDVAEYAADRLTQLGFDGSELNIIGHSFGAYIGNETAKRMASPVNSVVGLDPASNVFGGYDSEEDADFAENALHSWAFHSDDFYGNVDTPKTAAETFFIEPARRVENQPSRRRHAQQSAVGAEPLRL
jgi:pimeloyl-ACP methyl ester carboxylesterase